MFKARDLPLALALAGFIVAFAILVSNFFH